MAQSLDFIHRYIPAKQEQAPTLLLLHGTGGDEHDLITLGQGLMSHAALLSPRGRVLENGMARFFRRIAEGIFDLEDLQLQTHALSDFVQAASHAYGFDTQRVIAVGYSNGANIAASLLLLRPEVLAGAVLFHAMLPIRPEQQPDLHNVPVFIGAGRSDALVSPAGTEQLAQLLEQSGAHVTLHWQPGGHALNQPEVQAAAAWLAMQPF